MPVITNFDDKCIIVKIPIGIYKRVGLKEATRRCWRANYKKAKEAKYVLGTIDGRVLCVLKITKCYYATDEFCGKEKQKCKEDFDVNINLCEQNKRIQFDGEELLDDKKYLNKILPPEYIPKQNPVRYSY